MGDELTKKQKKELQILLEEILSLSTEVVSDYNSNPSEMSGSITQIHIDSPLLDETNDSE